MLRKLWIPTSQAQLLQAQERLLSHHNLTTLYKRKRVKLPSTLSKTLCGTDQLTINAIEYQSSKPKPNPSTCILAHGLGAGLGLFYTNLTHLSQRFDRVIAIDWLGFGGSSRPKWNSTTDNVNTSQSTDFFIDSLHEFLQQMNVTECAMIGHSLGGLLATEYAMKYPKTIQGLYLISPAGLPKPNSDLIQVNETQDVSMTLQLLDSAWQNNVTPGAIVRAMGPKGPENVQKTIQRRFNNRWNPNETEMISNYLYHITAAEPSGEYAMNGLLTPLIHPQTKKIGLYARRPLVNRMSTCISKDLPIHVVYGDTDWLYSSAPSSTGVDKAIEQLKKEGMNKLSFELIPNAGHHIYLDNSIALHQSIDQFIDRYNLN